MRLQKLRELLLAYPPQPGEPAHLSAASGLVRQDKRFYVVADDELQLGSFPVAGTAPGEMLRMIPGELPMDKEERKKIKPDFEALTLLAPFAGYPCGALLALGSGSRKHRRRGVLLALDAGGVRHDSIRIIDAANLYDVAAREVDDLNIEGAVAIRDCLVLMHRGNKSHAVNSLLSFDLHAVLKSIDDDNKVGKARPLEVRHYDLGAIEGVPLCFTDGAALPDGSIVFSAVAEDTSDSYRDGPCVGAAIGRIDPRGKLQAVEYLEEPYKVEGVHAEVQADGTTRLWLVTDADDARVPASLLYGTW